MNNPYKFRNTIKPVRDIDHYINSESLYLYHNGSFVLMDALLGGYTTLAVSGRELVPQSVNTTPYANGYDGSLVKYSNHTSRTIKVVYAVDLMGTSTPAFFARLNYLLSNGEIKFQFNDDRNWYYNGYVTAIGELSGKGDIRTGDFTITCYDPFKHHITKNSMNTGQHISSESSEGYANVKDGPSVATSNEFTAPSPISIVAVGRVIPNERLTITLDNNQYTTIDTDGSITFNKADSEPNKQIMIDVPADVTRIAVYLPTDNQVFSVYSCGYAWIDNQGFSMSNDATDITQYVDTQSDVDDWYFIGSNNAVEARSKTLTPDNNDLTVVYDEVSL